MGEKEGLVAVVTDPLSLACFKQAYAAHSGEERLGWETFVGSRLSAVPR